MAFHTTFVALALALATTVACDGQGADDSSDASGSTGAGSGVGGQSGAADGEVSLARARQGFADVEFHPSILRDVSTVDLRTTILGRPAAMP